MKMSEINSKIVRFFESEVNFLSHLKRTCDEQMFIEHYILKVVAFAVS